MEDPLCVVDTGLVVAAVWRINVTLPMLESQVRHFAAIGLVVNAILDKNANFLTTESLVRAPPTPLCALPSLFTSSTGSLKIVTSRDSHLNRMSSANPHLLLRVCSDNSHHSNTDSSLLGVTQVPMVLELAVPAAVLERPAGTSAVDFVSVEKVVNSRTLLVAQGVVGKALPYAAIFNEVTVSWDKAANLSMSNG